jgi:hypothetical protein
MKKKVIKCSPIEDEFALISLVKFDLLGEQIGGCLLKKGENNYKIQFGFACQGIHPTLRSEQIDPVFDSLEAGLKDLPQGETLTIHLGSFTDDTQRQQELSEILNNCESTEIRFLLMGEKTRIKALTEQGIRKPKFLHLYGTYTLENLGTKTEDKLEQIIAKLEKMWKGFIGELEEIQAVKMEQLLSNSFSDGYPLWSQLLSNKMGLNIRPLKIEEIWTSLWQRFNQSSPREIPQLLILDESGLREEINSQIHPLSLLIESEMPVADRKWVHINNKYVGVLTFADKPGGWKNKESELRYLWEVMAQERVYDTEIICQVSKGNQRLLKDKMQSLAKQANVQSQLSAEKNSIDVNAGLRLRKALAAQEELYEGAIALNLAIVFLVHRETIEALTEACKYLQSLFLRPAWVIRETEYPWQTWLQTFPLTYDKLLAKPFNRLSTYLSGEAPGLMPLVKTRSLDYTGFELISNEGGTPIYLDLFSQHKNLGLFATTRGGKSVLATGIITHALAVGMPVSAMDFPKPDGTGTFSDYTNFLADYGAYFDIGKEASNLFELPDLKGLNSNLQQERFNDYKDSLLEVLLVMVIGTIPRGEVSQDSVRSLLTLALEKFFIEPEIRERYAQANTEGFGTLSWEAQPTLNDFISFCSLERLQLLNPTSDLITALEYIKLRLRFWLNSRVGKAISQPSTFRSDAQFLVVALRNLASDEDAAIIALTVYMSVLRRALASPASILFIDEAPILFQFEAVAALIARLFANGAKSGIRVILSAQEPESIAQSPSAPKIWANMTTRLVGRIQPTAVDSYHRILKYPLGLIGRNATESFFPKKEGIYSQWLLDDLGVYTPCRYYPGYPLLAAVANNPDESASRLVALSRYDNKLIALNEFSKDLIQKIKTN